MPESFTTFLAGTKATIPLMLGVVPFGLICGAVCVDAGMPEWGAMNMSVIIFAGASQLAATQLLSEHAPLAVVILTALVINARFLMYSASIAPHFAGIHPLRKCMLAFMLTDQAYAMSIIRYSEPDGERIDKIAYFLGTAVFMAFSFNFSTMLGAYLGAFIPPEWDLDFAIPLTFTALVIPAVKDRPTLLAAVIAGIVSVIADPLPYNLGLLAAAIAGIISGYRLERRKNNG